MQTIGCLYGDAKVKSARHELSGLNSAVGRSIVTCRANIVATMFPWCKLHLHMI